MLHCRKVKYIDHIFQLLASRLADFNVLLGQPSHNSKGYPLRPEFFESTFAVSHAMGGSEELQNDVIAPAFLHLNHTLRTECAVASQSGDS